MNLKAFFSGYRKKNNLFNKTNTKTLTSLVVTCHVVAKHNFVALRA